MDFNEAAVFVRVVQAGSFSAAARQLGLPTSTVSTRVARLEQRLGITLLQRTTRKLHMTEAGAVFYQNAAQGVGYLLEAAAAVDEALQQPKGRLKVTAPADLGDALMAGLIVDIQREFPALEVELLFTDRYIDLVAEGVDVAIRAGELQDSSLMAKSLGTIRWALFASPDYLQHAGTLDEPQDLVAHPSLQFTPMGRDAWWLKRGHDSLTVSLGGRTMANSIGVIKTMALDGQGVALLPTFICRPEVAHGQLVRVLPDWNGRADPVHLVYPQQRFMAPKLRAFIDQAQEKLRTAFEE